MWYDGGVACGMMGVACGFMYRCGVYWVCICVHRVCVQSAYMECVPGKNICGIYSCRSYCGS